MSNTDHLLIVTYLWDDPKFKFRAKLKYGPEHVLALYRQLKRFLHVPFYFTVVCDEKMLNRMEHWTSNYYYSDSLKDRLEDPNLNSIDVYRIWDDYRDMGRCWRRLRGFSAYEFGHLSRVLFIDLDMLILDDITKLITDNEKYPFVIADDFTASRSKYNGSFVLFTPTPTTHKMWAEFDRNPAGCAKILRDKGYLGSDQAWIRHYLDMVKYPVKTIGKKDGLISFRWHCKDQKIDPFEAGAKMVNFHGPYMPDMQEIQDKYRWTQIYNAYSVQKNSHQDIQDKMKTVEDLFRRGFTTEEVCKKAKVSRKSLTKGLRDDPGLIQAKVDGMRKHGPHDKFLDRYEARLEKLRS